MLRNTKGMELAIGTIAIIAIVLLVLIVVVSFFFSGFGSGSGGIAGIASGAGDEAGDLDIGQTIGTMFPRCGDGIGTEWQCCETESPADTFAYEWVVEDACTDATPETIPIITRVRSSKCSDDDFTCSPLETRKILINCGKCLPE